jgi:hypothetical protein
LDSYELIKIAGAFLGAGAIFTHAKLVKPGYPLPAAQETAAAGNGAPAPSVPPISSQQVEHHVALGGLALLFARL